MLTVGGRLLRVATRDGTPGRLPMLTGLLDQLGVPRADVLGISWGGGLAQQFALSRQGRVHRLVLVATGPGTLMVPGNPRALLRMLTPRRHRDQGHAVRIAGELYGGSLREDPALARELLHATPRHVTARAGDTTTSCCPASAGPACRGCGSSGRPR